MKKIERKSSIESEPRTLSFEQIQYAREAALYVVHTQSFEEALRIFTEGLKPVVGGVKKGRVIIDSDDEHDFPDVAAGVKKGTVITNSDDEHDLPDVAAADRSSPSLICVSTLRDVVSAPF